MIQELRVVICDGCGEIAKAKIGGHHQRDELWVAPDDWSVGKNIGNVHFCPKCTARLNPPVDIPMPKTTYRSNGKEL